MIFLRPRNLIKNNFIVYLGGHFLDSVVSENIHQGHEIDLSTGLNRKLHNIVTINNTSRSAAPRTVNTDNKAF